MVIVSGSTTSRISLSLGCCAMRPVRRCVRRRKAATERVRSSADSSEVALVTVRRPRLRCSVAPRVGFGGSTTFVGRPGRRMMRLAVSSSSAAGRTTARGPAAVAAVSPAVAAPGRPGAPTPVGLRVTSEGAGSPPARRRRASVSVRRLTSASCKRRRSSSRLRLSAASRSSFSAVSRSVRALASTSARRRSSISRSRAPTRARSRASRSASERVRSTTPVAERGAVGALGGAAGGVAARGAAGAAEAAATGAGAGTAAGLATEAGVGAGAEPGALAIMAGRRFTVSTTTCLLRPCEKLCFTTSFSSGRFSDSVLGARVSFVSPGSFVSVIRLRS